MRHPNGAKLSDRQIAEHVGVDHKTVARYRDELTGEIPQSPTRTGRDGRTIDTTNIGSAATAPDPKTQPKEYARFASHDGASLRDIAKATGKSHEAVRKWLQPPKVDSKLTDGASPLDTTNATKRPFSAWTAKKAAVALRLTRCARASGVLIPLKSTMRTEPPILDNVPPEHLDTMKRLYGPLRGLLGHWQFGQDSPGGESPTRAGRIGNILCIN